MKRPTRLRISISTLTAFVFLWGPMSQAQAQQKELPEVTMLTAVPNFAFAAIWVAEQLKYFEAEGVRVKITPAPSGSVCLNAVVGRSTNFCGSTSEGLVLARVDGAPELPAALMNNVIDAYALSPPSAEVTEPSGKGYVLIPLGKGEVPELTDYPYEVLMVRPDYLQANPAIAT